MPLTFPKNVIAFCAASDSMNRQALQHFPTVVAVQKVTADNYSNNTRLLKRFLLSITRFKEEVAHAVFLSSELLHAVFL